MFIQDNGLFPWSTRCYCGLPLPKAINSRQALR